MPHPTAQPAPQQTAAPAARKPQRPTSQQPVLPGALKRPAAVWVGWCVAIAFQFWLVINYRWGAEDLVYYRNGTLLSGAFGAHIVGIGGAPTPLSEYPDAGVWPILAVKWLAEALVPGSELAFILIFALGCALLSGAFTVFLLRRGRVLGAWTWVAVCLCIGPILLTRLDVIPGLAVGVGVAVAASHPRISGGLLAFATASKLWPGILAATLVDRWHRSGTWARVGAFAVMLAALIAVTTITQGFGRVLSPLTYQDVRGLQVESIAATPFTLLSAFDERWDIHLSTSKSYEVTGPGVTVAMHAASALMAITVLVAVGIAVHHFCRGGWTPERALAAATMLVALLLVANKVFSPQYVLWLAPLVCLAMRASSGHTLILGGLTAAIAGLSFLVFPITYGWLVSTGPTAVPAAILTVRNLLCIGAAVVAARWWLRLMRG